MITVESGELRLALLAALAHEIGLAEAKEVVGRVAACATARAGHVEAWVEALAGRPVEVSCAVALEVGRGLDLTLAAVQARPSQTDVVEFALGACVVGRALAFERAEQVEAGTAVEAGIRVAIVALLAVCARVLGAYAFAQEAAWSTL